MLKAIGKFIETTLTFFSDKDDPVFNCPVYREISNERCVHIDGPLCDFPNCEIIYTYNKENEQQNGTS